MMMLKWMQFWTSVLTGLLCITMKTDARAVNVSNTWTMPPEGLNVFYRFFRDRISWFEADAVCQFHHANLVTVDNSFQFDATRDLLRELDVNDIVWIGLMRPQNSGRFMWSNSHPLVGDTGYWAESLPLMESPLCAVIDPIRDYRWHALRCGGPETASFLCEMPVPSWADICIIKDMPNLTMQYMADTASIELIRNCQEEGLLKQSCKTRDDRERAMQELICPKERLEAERINEITNSHFKSLQIINSFPTDNNENNNIDLMPMEGHYGSANIFLEQQIPTEKNTVQRLIEQFNVDELMQGDQPMDIPEEIPKTFKKSAKKIIIDAEYSRKEKARRLQEEEAAMEKRREAILLKERQKQKILSFDDMMMGDQPLNEPEILDHVVSDEVSNEILERLPHQKKVLPNEFKRMPGISETRPSLEAKVTKPEPQTLATTSSTSTSTSTPTSTTTTATTTTTTSEPLTTISNSDTSTSSSSSASPAITTLTSISSTEVNEDSPSSSNGVTFLDTSTSVTKIPHSSSLGHLEVTSPSATIGHPMHPQQPRGNIITEETQHPHIKESADSSHFIPPMLLVKSHYVPTSKHGNGDHLPHLPPQMPETGATPNPRQEEISKPLSAQSEETNIDVTKVATDAIMVTDNPVSNATPSSTIAPLMLSTLSTPIAMATESETLPEEIPETQTSFESFNDPATTATILETTTFIEPAKQMESNESGKQMKMDVASSTTLATITVATASSSVSIANSLDKDETIGNDKNHHQKKIGDTIVATSSLPTPTSTIATTIPPATIGSNSGDEADPEKVETEPTLASNQNQSNEKDNDQDNGKVTNKNEKDEEQNKGQDKDKEKPESKENSEENSKEIKKIPQLQQVYAKDKSSSSSEEARNDSTSSTMKPISSTTSAVIPSAVTQGPAGGKTLSATNKPQEFDSTVSRSTEQIPKQEQSQSTTMKIASELPLMKTTKELLLATSTPGSTSPSTSISTSSSTSSSTSTSTTTTTTTTTTVAPPPSTTHNFLKDETEPPYKPNRRRALTNPESPSYLKKILG